MTPTLHLAHCSMHLAHCFTKLCLNYSSGITYSSLDGTINQYFFYKIYSSGLQWIALCPFMWLVANQQKCHLAHCYTKPLKLDGIVVETFCAWWCKIFGITKKNCCVQNIVDAHISTSTLSKIVRHLFAVCIRAKSMRRVYLVVRITEILQHIQTFSSRPTNTPNSLDVQHVDVMALYVPYFLNMLLILW